MSAAATAQMELEQQRLEIEKLLSPVRVFVAGEKAPSCAEAEAFALEFDRLDRALTDAEKAAKKAAAPVAALKKELIELVRKFGGPHGKSSKLLHGIEWELMGTFGKTTTTDNAAVERFRVALKKRGKTVLLKKLFTQDTRWTFSAKASEIIKAEKKPLTPALMGLLLQCFDTDDCTPKLDVRPKKKAV